MRNSQRVLLISSLVVSPFTFGVFQILPAVLGLKWGYIAGLFLYWLYCLFTAWLVAGSNLAYLKRMFTASTNHKYTTLINLAAFIPVAGVFFVSFLLNAPGLTPGTALLVTLVALLNGAIEEMYWRGLYLAEYKSDWRIGLLAATFLFGCWHISLWAVNGIDYRGGAAALIGGAFVMGLLWAWVARAVGNIRAVVLAHILVNFFAFSGLFVMNGF